MDLKKIGSFLKDLRKEKGLTQEQLAEKIGVAGRTVSRWETASNMPDLSILIQLAEFYNVEVGEILDGKRKAKDENKDLKETLSKISNYNKADKLKRTKISNTAFLITLFVCTATLLIQFVFLRNFQAIIGEYITLIIGATSCVIMTIKNGLWHKSQSIIKNIKFDLIITFVMSSVFTLASTTAVYLEFQDLKKSAVFSIIFFFWIAFLSFSVLCIIAKINQKRNS